MKALYQIMKALEMEAVSSAMGSRKVPCFLVIIVNVSSDKSMCFYLFILKVFL